MKKRLFGKVFFSLVLLSVVFFPVVIGAYSGSYSFDISHKVDGTKKHSLDNKLTTTSVKANTYWANGDIKATKSTFVVDLKRLLKTYSTRDLSANNIIYTTSFGTVTKSSYKVTVRTTTIGSYGDRVKGSGTIKQ